MPSQARLIFERHLLKDVHRLIDAHKAAHPGRGRPLSVYTRSGVFLLSAAWELYVEEVALEGVDWLIHWAPSPADLPQDARDAFANSVRQATPLDALALAGDGWKDMLRVMAKQKVAALNTPSGPRIVALFKECLGVNVNPLIGPHIVRLQDFANKRGSIAHQGVQAGHVGIGELEADYAYICGLVVQLDNYLIDPLREVTGYRPWNRRG